MRNLLFYTFILSIIILCRAPGLYAQESKRIEIVNANTLMYDEDLGNGAKRLIGNVIFKQEDVMMYADSAYYYDNNMLDAFGKIHVNKKDTLHLYGDMLHYDGNSRICYVTGKQVRMEDRQMTLTTTRIDYNMKTNVGFYRNGGKIVNRENTLTSKSGDYYSAEQNFYFRHQVELKNKDYTLLCDTLKYNTRDEKSFFLGPTHLFGDDTRLYCENGWYTSTDNHSHFSRHAWLKNKNQKISGDSLFYFGDIEYAQALKNVVAEDSSQKMQIRGDRLEYFGLKDLSYVTGRAEMLQFFKDDTLHLHADTLIATYDSVYFAAKNKFDREHASDAQTKGNKNNKKSASGNKGNSKDKKNTKAKSKNTKFSNDSLAKQHRLIRAYYKVKFFKNDLQGIYDSLAYSSYDSLMRLFGAPVLWSGENQLKADYMRIKMYEGDIYNLFLDQNSFISSQIDSSRYNQIKGKKMTGYFTKNELQRIKVSGNGQAVYYARDKDEKLIGVNRSDCSDMVIYLKDEAVQKITMYQQPSGTMYPVKDAPKEEIMLKDFEWLGAFRPSNAGDIFNWRAPLRSSKKKKKSSGK